MTEKGKKKKEVGARKRFSLQKKLTLFIGIVLLLSILIALGIMAILDRVLVDFTGIPRWIQLNFISFIVAVIATRYLSRIFFIPIRQLNQGMKKVADGDFSVRLSEKSSSQELREIFAGFNMMVKELSSTEILQTDFVSNVSHEIKTPINAIEGYTTLLQGCESLNEEQQKYVEKILFNTERLSTLVSNILLLSKLENQTIKTHREPYGLDEQIRESIVELEPAWEAKAIELDVELDNIEYNGNELMMRHVWNNLLGNAIKFSPVGGKIKIYLKRKAGSFKVLIEDEGPGLSEEAKKHLFDKFYQADTSHKEEGNGLGLALVKRILSIEGGEISAENAKPKGCCVTVTLYPH